MGFGEHRPFECVRWRHARLQTTEQTAGPGRWKIPPGVQPRPSACWVDRSQVRGTGRQPGSRRELAGASQLSCPHSDSRILSAQASRQDKDLREACGAGQLFLESVRLPTSRWPARLWPASHLRPSTLSRTQSLLQEKPL
ncbi:unnamed protein product [Rangifer tarandus platyrhynchus]|uniref:Uncharacterized protein n=2 Tax=Rangifer tarandus platyrhynchus TaxID=3082113 RepID=A0AC60A9D1_RANTA|nr:unnamed protein product [Rangifer tarandus platyrhynchus]